MFYSCKVRQAMIDCFTAHKEDKDKGGYPYFYHPLILAIQFDDEESVCVALLHDVVEDHPDKYSISYIREKYGNTIADAVNLLTYNKGVPYLEYIKNIKKNEIARKVKIVDLKHNTDLDRLNGKKPPKYELYIEALKLLNC